MPRPEQGPLPYQRANRFADERPADRAYTAAQHAIFAGAPNDLSPYRFPLNRIYHRRTQRVATTGAGGAAEPDPGPR